MFAGAMLGVMRTSAGILHFFINGEDQGIAANCIPAGVHAVVDIYGKCTQVSITSVRLFDANERPCKCFCCCKWPSLLG